MTDLWGRLRRGFRGFRGGREVARGRVRGLRTRRRSGAVEGGPVVLRRLRVQPARWRVHSRDPLNDRDSRGFSNTQEDVTWNFSGLGLSFIVFAGL